jgi:hypothetical protein
MVWLAGMLPRRSSSAQKGVRASSEPPALPEGVEAMEAARIDVELALP